MPDNMSEPHDASRPSAPGAVIVTSTPPPAPDTCALERTVHDLRNLIDGSHRQVNLVLRAIKEVMGSSSTIGASAGEHAGDEVAKRLRVIRSALEQMTVTLAQVSSGRSASLENDRRTLAEAISHAAGLLEPKAARLDAKIKIELSPEFLQAPAGAMYSVILNAVSNALESIKQSGRRAGRVWITGSVQQLAWSQRLCIEISDNGLGPPEGIDPFADHATTKPGHLGIGLSMAAQIVASAHGQITLGHREPGPGALLRVLLPHHTPENESETH
jgi:signal transduction histidine kinase